MTERAGDTETGRKARRRFADEKQNAALISARELMIGFEATFKDLKSRWNPGLKLERLRQIACVAGYVLRSGLRSATEILTILTSGCSPSRSGRKFFGTRRLRQKWPSSSIFRARETGKKTAGRLAAKCGAGCVGDFYC
ncbi:hypothetical protein DFH07DRAFT_778700 [Mycena maculata]|uniref:Uncharacterized protein n=1 Tax=Mycena maculata TaxID=230809 RepID=A0AAD7IBL2_9AGAR|nr:hypothetical protein DFH07DRAFT_778700 [Mycena maculata]